VVGVGRSAKNTNRRGLGLAAPAQADTAVKTPVIVASAINIPTDFGHHAWVVDIQPQTNVPHR
jgi:hypothetical protein